MVDETKMMLVVEAGKSKGKKITLKKSEYALGSERKCNVRLTGDFVSPLHAVLKLRDEDQWVIQNRSPNQTLVNNQVVDTKPLVVGDSIQIGASNLLRFDVVSKKPSKDTKLDDGGDKTSALAALMKKPAVLAGLVFYVVLLVVVFSLLSGKSDEIDPSNWNRARIGFAINESTEYLIGAPLEIAKQDEGESAKPTVQADSEPSAEEVTEKEAVEKVDENISYDEILRLRAAPDLEDQGQLQKMTISLMADVSAKLEHTWHLEQQGRWRDVITSYNNVLNLVPDINLPITKMVVERKRWAEKKKKESR